MPEIVREKHGGKTTASELALDTILGRELIRECGEVSHLRLLEARSLSLGSRRSVKVGARNTLLGCERQQDGSQRM